MPEHDGTLFDGTRPLGQPFPSLNYLTATVTLSAKFSSPRHTLNKRRRVNILDLFQEW